MKNDMLKKSDRYTYLTIENNVLRADNTIVQLNSICRTKVGKYIMYSLPNTFIICLLCACVFFGMASIFKLFYVAAIASLVYGIYVLINELKTDVYYMILELNSGSKLLFECYDKGFLKTVQEEVVKCMYSKSGCSINFNTCVINKQTYNNRRIEKVEIDRSQIGDGNQMKNTED